MKPDADKNRKLISQYHFLKEIINHPFLPYQLQGPPQVDDLVIKVERADANLMYRQGKNTGILNTNGSVSWSAPMEGPRDGQAGKRGHYLLAINRNGAIVNRLDWLKTNYHEPVYGWQVLWATKTGHGSFSNPLWDDVEYLVWVTVETWHEFIRNFEDTPFGAFIDRTMTVTIYTAPEQGYQKLQEEANIFEHLYLNNDVMLEGTMRDDHKILMISGMLAELCLQFKTDVYDNGMREIANSHPKNRIAGSGQFGHVEVLVGEMCDYERIMLEDDSSYITFQIRPGSTHAYVLGMNGRLPQLRRLVRTVIEHWNNKENAHGAFSYNQNISVM